MRPLFVLTSNDGSDFQTNLALPASTMGVTLGDLNGTSARYVRVALLDGDPLTLSEVILLPHANKPKTISMLPQDDGTISSLLE